MNKKLFAGIIVCCSFHFAAKAQLAAEQRIQDSVIGWWSNNKYDHFKPQTDATGKKKELYVNKMVEWMKKSYIPVGGLGTTSRYVDKSGYGVLCYVWNVSHDKMWTEPNGSFRPIPEENTPFWIAANRVFGSFSIPYLEKTNEYYFTMQPDGYCANDQALRNYTKADPRIHPNAYNRLTWINEWQTVYLTPNNKLPFIAITKGELLQRAEEALDKQLENETKDVQAKWPDNKKSQDEALAYRKQTIDKYRSNIQKLKERHKNSLNEPAVIRDMQPTMYSFETDPDIFKIDNYEKGLKHYYQVYKVNPELYAKMQSDAPQWIAIAFPFATKENGNQLYELFTSLSQNFNYDFVYNYFFDPGKIKGTEYTPANEASLTARLNAYRNKNKHDNNVQAANNTWAYNVHFQDDFSDATEGSAPPDWYYYKAGSKSYTVTTIKGEKGKWLQLGYGRSIKPSLLKTLPADFTLEFDLATDGNFTGRTGGAAVVTLTSNKLLPNNDVGGAVAGKGATITLRVESGNEADYNNNNYRGVLRADVSNFPEQNEENYSRGIRAEYALTQFTDKKTSVHITFQLQNGSITIMVNNKPVIKPGDFKMTYGGKCKLCGIAPGIQFTNILFSNTTNESDKVGVYAGNIKITKE